MEPFRLAWPISDVEPFNRSKIPDTRTREALALKAKELWIEEARPEKMGVQPLPDLVDCDNVREFLRRAQLDSGEFRPVIDQLRAGLDPEGVRKRKTGAPKLKGPLRPIELESYRLSPVDGVLEKSVNLAVEVLDVPCIPEVQVATEKTPMSWRRWLFEQCHCTFMSPHRRSGPTFRLLRRVGWWPTLTLDFMMHV